MTGLVIALAGFTIAAAIFMVVLAWGLLGVIGDDWRGEP